MKKFVSLTLAVVLMVSLFCGCTQEFRVKVNKSGSCTIGIMSAIPVETMEEMLASGEMSAEDQAEMVIKKVNGEDCYVGEETKKFSSLKKAGAYMLDEEEVGLFEAFKLSTSSVTATAMEGLKDSMAMYEGYVLKLYVTMPYIITKTNGTLSADKKTVTFDMAKVEKMYAYTVKSSKGNKVYFEKEYLKTNDSAYLDWNAVKGATKYKVSYKASGDKKWQSVTTKKTAKTITGLKAGKTYSFKVTAVTKKENYTSMVTKVATLKAVTAKVKSKTDKSVKLTWSKDKNADGYIVYKRASKKTDWTKVKSTKTNTCTVSKLKAEKTYYFKVIAYAKENGKTIKSSGKALSAKTY